MPRPILDLTPFPGATFRDEFEALDSFMEDGPGEERVLVADGLARRVYSWPTADFPEDARIRAAFLAGYAPHRDPAAAQRVVFMDNGQVVEVGPPDQIFINPTHERTQLFLSKIIKH